MARDFTQLESARVLAVLDEKGVAGDCPMCKRKKSMNVVRGIPSTKLLANLDQAGQPFGADEIWCVALLCSNCGFLSQHSIGPLELVEFFKNG